jgi:hypothetical protein
MCACQPACSQVHAVRMCYDMPHASWQSALPRSWSRLRAQHGPPLHGAWHRPVSMPELMIDHRPAVGLPSRQLRLHRFPVAAHPMLLMLVCGRRVDKEQRHGRSSSDHPARGRGQDESLPLRSAATPPSNKGAAAAGAKDALRSVTNAHRPTR